MDGNPILGFALPPFVFSGKSVVIIDKGTINVDGYNASGNQFPLTLRAEGLSDFTFPLDPIIRLSFKNIITKRTVAKGKNRGTVKERWTEDDVEISISGVFISKDGEYPTEVNQLRAFFAQHKAVEVICDHLNQRDINQIAFESLDLPHTKGTENQAFEIKACSDDAFQLLIES